MWQSLARSRLRNITKSSAAALLSAGAVSYDSSGQTISVNDGDSETEKWLILRGLALFV